MSKASDIRHKKIIDVWFTNGFNGTQAYMKIVPGVAEETAKMSFSRLITNDNIQIYIEKKHQDSKKLSGVTHQRMLNELVNFAFSDMTEVIGLTPEEVKELPIDIRRLVVSFKEKTITKGTGKDKVITKEIQLKFPSKERAFDMIAKHIGFYGEHNYQKSGILSSTEREALIAKYKEKFNIKG